jgi:mannose-6-phosphate isomerase-like protein (cupin superfamily)
MSSRDNTQARGLEPRAINLKEKFSQFSEHWSPRKVGMLNDCQITLAKTKGEFVWHAHEDTDEVFLVVEGEMTIEFRDGEVHLEPGEMFVVPRGVEHKPFCREECHVLVIDREGTVNTGGEETELTVKKYPEI